MTKKEKKIELNRVYILIKNIKIMIPYLNKVE